MTTQRDRDDARAIHLLVADLSRTACGLPAMPALNTTTEADFATCRECILRSGRFSSRQH